MNIKTWIPFYKRFFSEQWAKIFCYCIIFLTVIKNGSSPVNSSTQGCACKTHNHQWEICISNQKSPYIPMEPYLQQYCQRHIQEYIIWNRNRHKPVKITTGMMLLSLLRVQDDNITNKTTSPLCKLFGEQITRMRCSKFYASFDSFMTYPPLSLLKTTGSKTLFT